MPTPPLSLEIDTSQIDSFVQRFPVSGPRIAERELRIGLDDALGYTASQVVDFTPVNTGVLRESVYDEIAGIKVDVLGGTDLEGIVSSSDYEPKVNAVEFGRKPGKMPPVEAIALWVRRKGLAGTYRVKTGKSGRHARIGGREKQRKEDLSLAWAIAIRISRFGTKGAFMFEKGLAASEAYIVKAMDAAINRILAAWSGIR